MVRYYHEIFRAKWISYCGIVLFCLLCVFLWLALERDFYIQMYFQSHCKLCHLGLLYYFFDHLPRLFVVLSCIHFPCCSNIPPLGILIWPPYCVQHSAFCVCLMCACHLYRIILTNINFCCYFYSPLDQLDNEVSVSCRVDMDVISCCIISPWYVELLSLRLGYTTLLCGPQI